jgi:hypothetical protein
MILDNIVNLIEEIKLGLPTREAARSHVESLRTKRAYNTFKQADLNTKAKIIAKGVPSQIKKSGPNIASMVGTNLATGGIGIDIPDAIKVVKELRTDPSRLKSPKYLGSAAARLFPGSGAVTAAKALTYDSVVAGTKQMGLEERRQKLH